MKLKSWMLLSVFLLCSFSAFAQWGVKGGVDFSSATSASEGRYQTGFNIGAVYDMKVSKRMYFQPGLLFVTNGLDFATNEYVTKSEVNIYALEVPLSMSFRPRIGKNMKLITDFGLYARCGLFGETSYEFSGGTSTHSTSIHESPFDAYNRFDMGLNIGIGLSYSNFALLGAYQLGFTRVEKDLKGMEHKKIRISVIYYFK